MPKLLTLFTFLFLLTSITFAQNTDANFVEAHYIDYFILNPETIYTQINKSKFSNGESLWFKSYIYNTQTQEPYISTTNVYASVYNAEGQVMEKKIYHAEKGMTQGDFSLKNNYPSGIYFLKVSTNWMRNFNEPHYSLEKFEILGDSIIEPTIINKEHPYDFQLLPEGGHLLENANNSIGFKTIDDYGEPLKISSGKVLDNHGNTLSNFKSNSFGIGKFNVFIKENESYKVEFSISDSTITTKSIPKAEAIGIALSVNNLNEDNLFIGIKTNKKTLPGLLNASYFFLLHRDGLSKKIDLKFEAKTYEYTIAVPKEELYSGMNILTLFNNRNQPILERLFFNKTDDLFHQLLLLSQQSQSDTTQIRLVSKIKNSLKKTISISVLPATSEAYNDNNTITSAFYLQPYLKGHIDNPNYYFKENTRKTNYDLDLLLLTQGWSCYNWQNIFSKAQIAKYNFEKGFQIKGKIEDPKANEYKEIVLFSAKTELLLTSDVKNSYFSFEDLALMDSSVVSLSAKNKKGQLENPTMYFNVFPSYIRDSINTINMLKKDLQLKYSVKVDNNFIYDDSATTLDTVLLSYDRKDKGTKEKFMTNGGVNNKFIDLENGYGDWTRLLEVIRINGFDVIEEGFNLQILSRRATGFFNGPVAPNIYLDNMKISEGSFDLIQYLTIADIDELYIAKTGFGTGGAGGSINIFTNRGASSKNYSKGNFNNNTIKLGFSRAKSYYAPLYNTSDQETFSKIGVLNWFPNLESNENDEFVFKIPNYYYESINLYIEGMCEDGSLISTVETIKID